MTTTANFGQTNAYYTGETFIYSATLTESDGVTAITTGTIVLRLSNTAPSGLTDAADLELTGSHAGAGVWTFSATTGTIAAAITVVSGNMYYQVWDDTNDRMHIQGTIYVAPGLATPA